VKTNGVEKRKDDVEEGETVREKGERERRTKRVPRKEGNVTETEESGERSLL